MRISSFFYTIKQGIKNIFRNAVFSLASIATISSCLLLFGVFYAMIANFQNIVKHPPSLFCKSVGFLIHDNKTKRLRILKFISDFFKGKTCSILKLAVSNIIKDAQAIQHEFKR